MRCRATRYRPALGSIVPPLQAKKDRGEPQPNPALSLVDVPAHAGDGGTSATRLPERLQAGVEALSGIAMDDVRVHRNSSDPARIGALAYARGRDIHLGPGQDGHLPHEAWHVAQQKQGRVGARGRGLNVDPTLEAEADRMGNVASRGGAPAGTGQPRRVTAAPGVIQPKVVDGELQVYSQDPVSPTLLTFIKKKKWYRLRDDFHNNRMAEPVHLLDMSKKYLLGETHGSAATAKWDDATKFWSRVGKMFEWTKALPASERREVGMPPDSAQDQPLESRHAWTLTEVLRAQDRLNVVGASWIRTLWTDPASKGSVRGFITDAMDSLAGADFGNTEYAEFLKAYDATGKHSKRSRQVQAFAVAFRDVYHPAILALTAFLQTAVDNLDNYDPKAGDAAKVKADFEMALDDVAANRAFLVGMAGALINLTGARGKELKAFETVLSPTDSLQGTEILKAVDPARERAMAENIIAAEAPLFVKVGDDHVDDLKKMVGPSAVAIHQTESLEALTKQPPDP